MDAPRLASWRGEIDEKTARRFRAGPSDPRGVLVDCSDRPLLCLSVSDDGRDVVVGGADHAAYGVDASRPANKPTRTLYGKTKGHHEWVTGVAHCGGAVATCGVDGRLCLWRGAACDEVVGPGGASLSVLLADAANPHLLLAAGYDGAARLFDVSSRRPREVGRLAPAGRKAPVLCATWRGRDGVLGDRDGRAACYDLEAAKAVVEWRPKDAGHCVSLCALETGLVLTGHQDGNIRCWDPREASSSRPSWAAAAHVRGSDAGAVSCLAALGDDVASCGADRSVVVTDPRAGKPRHRFREHRDFPYCLATLGDSLIFTGAGDGALLCHDVSGAGECAWGLGAGLSAVRCVDARPDQLVAAGDDGNVLIWRL